MKQSWALKKMKEINSSKKKQISYNNTQSKISTIKEENNLTTKNKSRPKNLFGSIQRPKTGKNRLNPLQTSKSKNKSQTSKINSKEVNAEKEIIEEKININDLLIVTIGQELPFNIKFTPDSLGRFKASVVFQIDNGISFDVDILANVIGPEIAINTPLIDFGLFASGTIQKREIEIENLSPIM